MFQLNNFFFFLVNNASSCVSRMILSAVCTSNFFQAIFLNVVRLLFIAFDTCLSFSIGLPVVFIFLAFETPQGSWDELLNSLSVELDSLFAFSYGDSSYVCNSLFSLGSCYLLFCSQCQLPTPDNPFGSVEFSMWVGSAFRRMKGFYF